MYNLIAIHYYVKVMTFDDDTNHSGSSCVFIIGILF